MHQVLSASLPFISTETFRKIVLEVADGIIGVDIRGTIRFANPAAERIFGWHENTLTGKSLEVLLPDRLRHSHGGLVMSFWSGDVDTRRMGQRDSGIVGLKADGSEVNLGITILRTDADGEPLLIAVIRDISEVARRHQELKRLAETDSLTGLLNRRAFFEQAAAILERQGGCIILLDLDHFKSINDQFGHDAGDRVIACFGQSLASAVRSSDLTARLGGEEFVVLLPDASIAEAVDVAERIRLNVIERQSDIVPGRSITVSAGVTDVTAGLDDALKRADLALYEAKNGGRNRVVRSAA